MYINITFYASWFKHFGLMDNSNSRVEAPLLLPRLYKTHRNIIDLHTASDICMAVFKVGRCWDFRLVLAPLQFWELSQCNLLLCPLTYTSKTLFFPDKQHSIDSALICCMLRLQKRQSMTNSVIGQSLSVITLAFTKSPLPYLENGLSMGS